MSKTKTGILDLNRTGEINLVWGISPRDLDLHLHIETDYATKRIFYSNKGTLSQEPWAELDNDDTHGSGSETIIVNRWLDGPYRCYVHNFSKDIPLAGSGARVIFSCGNQEHIFVCPNDGMGTCWSVFTLDTRTGSLEPINEIIDQLP